MGLGAILRLIRALPLVATLFGVGWFAWQDPLAAPYIAREGRDLALTLERQVRLSASTTWLNAELAKATAEKDAARATMLLGLAQDLGRDVEDGDAIAMIEAETGLMASAASCGGCMIDIRNCQSVGQIAACAAPFELSPLGDLNALRRAGVAWAAGQEVDQVDAGLALVGLGATGAVIVTGGGSATAKAGTALIRMARRLGTLTPDLARLLRLPITWRAVPRYLAGSARLEDVTDPVQAARVVSVARDLDAVRLATSSAEALTLMRFVDSAGDARRLSRVADVMGPRTTRTAEILGKSRLMRATIRLSNMAATFLVLLAVAILQIAGLFGSLLGGQVLKRVVRAAR